VLKSNTTTEEMKTKDGTDKFVASEEGFDVVDDAVVDAAVDAVAAVVAVEAVVAVAAVDAAVVVVAGAQAVHTWDLVLSKTVATVAPSAAVTPAAVATPNTTWLKYSKSD